ncbi:MAG: hypothetical protein AAF577_05615 [Pseudomonadota bacterium]
MRHSVSALMLTVCTAITGCGSNFLSTRATNPVIKENVGPVIDIPGLGPDTGVLALRPDRRLTIFKETDQGQGRLFCSEPSPDVADAAASIFTLQGQLELQQQGGTSGSGSLGIGNAIALQPNQIFSRTQGVQFYRDRSFQLCQMFLNGVFGPADSSEALAAYLEAELALTLSARSLIELELTEASGPLQQGLQQQVKNQAISDVKEIAGVVKDLTPPPAPAPAPKQD